MEELFVICCVIFLPYLIVTEDSISTVVPINVELNSTIKSPLRYGFQKTGECLNFEKSFICIQKCLDLNYDVAYADANCKCTCHIKKEKAQYTLRHNFTRTIWKLGAPTTSIPPWAQHKKKTEKPDPQLIAEIDEADPTEAMVTTERNISTKTPTVSKSHDGKSSVNSKVTPGGLVNAGTGEGPLPNGTTIGNLASASSGTGSSGAATVANLTTEAAAGTVITTAHDVHAPAETIVTQAS